jgi:hypothetical protein
LLPATPIPEILTQYQTLRKHIFWYLNHTIRHLHLHSVLG